ncbi:hypothetical protein [Nocardiopsis oceani]
MDIFVRDAAMTMAIFGLFAFVWFGFAHEQPPPRRRGWLAAGNVLGLAVAVTGGVLATLNWGGDSVMSDPSVLRLYLVIVAIEFGVALIGAVVLLRVGRGQYLTPWILLVVGVHFFPLAVFLADPTLHVLGTVLTVWAFASVWWGNRHGLAYSYAVGLVAGTLLLLFALFAAVRLLLTLS